VKFFSGIDESTKNIQKKQKDIEVAAKTEEKKRKQLSKETLESQF
jgi:hypothetical protein